MWGGSQIDTERVEVDCRMLDFCASLMNFTWKCFLRCLTLRTLFRVL